MNPAAMYSWLRVRQKEPATMPRLASTPPSITVARQPTRPTRMLHRGPVVWRQEGQG